RAGPIAPDAAGRAARMIQKLRLDAPVFNEDHADPTLATLDGLLAFENASAEPHDPAGPKPPADATLRFSLRLAAWLIDRHRPSADGAAFELSTAINAATPALRRWRRALCLTNLDRDAIRRMFDLLNRALSWSELRCAQRKRLLASPRWEQAFVLLHALGWDARLRRLAERIAEDAPELETDGIGIQPAPLLNGNDLIDSGLKPSPRFKSLLDEAYDLQLEGKLYTRAQARQWLAEQR
ncbi:MAG: hypothetical protein JJU36_08975, partial [Phycisphaeraceae bacterium]|nr:hypothetical protein [Phycisphaeraceae bacterium]